MRREHGLEDFWETGTWVGQPWHTSFFVTGGAIAECSKLPEVPLVKSQNVAGQQRIGRGMRNHSLPYASPSDDTHTKKKTCDASSDPISAV